MSLRELIILLLGLVIVGIILRGLYVALQARRGQLRMAIDKNIPSDIDLEALELAELPGGGARVVSRDTVEDESGVSAPLEAANQRAESFSLGVEDEAVPVLMDSVEVGQVAQIDTAASNTSHADERTSDDAYDEEWDDRREDRWDGEWDNEQRNEQRNELGDGSENFEDADATARGDEFETVGLAAEPVPNNQHPESPTVATSQDLFDDEPGEKRDPLIGDLQADEAPATDTRDASVDEFNAYDEHDEYDETVPAESREEIGSDRAAVGHGFREVDAAVSEHPDDVLFDYDSEDDYDSETSDQNYVEEAHAAVAESDRNAGPQRQYESEPPVGVADEDDVYGDEEGEGEGEGAGEEDEAEHTSVFLSGHDHVGGAAQAESASESLEAGKDRIVYEDAQDASTAEHAGQFHEQDYEKAHEEPHDSAYEDDEHEVGDEPEASQAAEDNFAEFSMTAGERIGGNPSAEKQAGLFDQFDEPEHAALAQRGKLRKKPSLFAALKRRFTATDSDIDELSASGPGQHSVAPEQHVEPDLVERAEDDFATGVAADTEHYEAASVQADQADTRMVSDPEPVFVQPAAEAQSELDDQGNTGWEEAEDSEQLSPWGDEYKQQAFTEAEDELEHIEAESHPSSHETRQIDWAGAARPEPRQQAPVSQPSEIKQQTPAVQPSEVIVLNVVARGGREFRGDDLLEVLITSGLKFGEMNIFHQRFRGTNNGPVIFSVANILNPGTFDLNSIHEFSTVGVSLFLALPSPINNLEAFDQMLGVAQRIREELDGELKDDHRNVMTAQTIEHYRQRIRDFELRQLKAAGGRA